MMDKPLTSFRDLNRQRKRQQDAVDAARSLADSVADGNANTKDYSDQLGDMQAAQELTSEATESSVNELRSANTTLKDQLAAHELIAENTEQTNNELRNIGSKLDNGYKKISEFAQLLKDKFKVEIQQTPITPVSPSTDVTEVIEQDAPAAEPPKFSAQDYLKRIADGIETINNKQEKPKEDKPEVEDVPEDKKKDDDERFELLLDRVSAIAKTVDKGYKKTINIADDIASMLFKYTVTAAMNAAKMAALIFGIVLLADLIQIHFRHWSKMFEENYAEFKKQLGSLAAPMETVITRLGNLVDYWKKGEYGNFVKEIGESVADASKYLFEYLLLGLSKMFAVAFRAMHMDETADTIEATSVLRAAREVGYQPSDEETEVIGRVEARKAKEERKRTLTSQGVPGAAFMSALGDYQLEQQGIKLDDPNMLSKAATIQAKVDNLAIKIPKNKANPKLNEEYGKEIQSYRSEVQSLTGLLPSRVNELKEHIDMAEKLYKEQKELLVERAEQTAPKKDEQANPDVATANSIVAQESKPKAEKEPAAQITQNTSVVNSNKVVNVNNPQTNMSSPGVGYNL